MKENALHNDIYTIIKQLISFYEAADNTIPDNIASLLDKLKTYGQEIGRQPKQTSQLPGVFALSSVACFLIAPTGKFLDTSNKFAEMLESSPVELIRRNFSEIVKENSTQNPQTITQRLFEAPESINELVLLRNDKSAITVKIHATTEQFNGSDAVRLLAAGPIHNTIENAALSGLKQNFETLSRVQRNFSSIINHDLRNTFQVILGSSQLLLEYLEMYNPQKNRRFLLMLYKAAKNGSDLLENLLYWERWQTRGLETLFQPVDIAFLVQKNIDTLQPLLKEKDIKIINNLPEDTIIKADKNAMSVAVKNLLSNIHQKAPKPTTITIDWIDTGQYYTLQFHLSDCTFDKLQFEEILNNDYSKKPQLIPQNKNFDMKLILSIQLLKLHNAHLSITEQNDTTTLAVHLLKTLPND